MLSSSNSFTLRNNNFASNFHNVICITAFWFAVDNVYYPHNDPQIKKEKKNTKKPNPQKKQTKTTNSSVS